MEQALWHFIRQIPQGCFTTYGSLARSLGDLQASRWVGQQLLHHAHHTECNCHRVVRADGATGKYAGGSSPEKKRRLEAEGVVFRNDKVANIDLRYDKFRGPAPLDQLRRLQQQLAAECRLESCADVRRIAGVDVSYQHEQAFAAYVAMDADGRDVASVHIQPMVASFPYITSYLAFRELPVLQALLAAVRQQQPVADLIMVDGSGIAHPRRAGIATMLGVLEDVPTIGVTKTHLAGSFDAAELTGCGTANLTDSRSGESLGAALIPLSGSRKPLFVSAGHRITPGQAIALVQRTMHRHRLPEPIYWADRHSRAAARASQSV